MINTIIIDGIVGCQPIEETHPNTGEKSCSFLLYNNEGKGKKGTGIWCRSNACSYPYAKTVKKGQDVTVQGRLEDGVRKNEETGQWHNGTIIGILILKYGRLNAS